MVKEVFGLLMVLCCTTRALCQATTAQFAMPANVCSSERLSFDNLSTNSTSFEWDFCQGALKESPVYADLGVINGAVSLLDLKVIEDNGHFYGFSSSADNNRLMAFDFFDNIKSNPSVLVLDPGLGTPTGVDLFYFNNLWYGIVGDFGNPAQFKLLSFGSSLSNLPNYKLVTIPSIQVHQARSLKVVVDAGNVYLFVANWTGGNVSRILLDPSLDGSVLSADAIAMPGSSNLMGLDAIKIQGEKFMMVSDYTTGLIYKLTFGNVWSNAPSIATQTLVTPVSNPTNIQLAVEDNAVMALLAAEDGSFNRLEYPIDFITNAPLQSSLGTFGGLSAIRGMSLIYTNGQFHAFFSSYLQSRLSRLDFEKSCSYVNVQRSTDVEPSHVNFNQAGNYWVQLTARNGNKDQDFTFEQIQVSGQQSPIFTIQTDGSICATYAVNFSTSLTAGTFNWNFGDGQVSTDSAPSNVFSTPGQYDVELTVTGGNTCKNYDLKKIKIYNPPVASFTLPSGLICTNNVYTIANTTPDNYDGNMFYQWDVNNVSVSTDRDLVYTFTAAGNTDIKLKTALPGCESTLTQNIPAIVTGPSVNFSFSGICQSSPTQFTDGTVGSVQTYAWDFKDGNASSLQNPQNTFTSIGDYSVTLTAINAAGCNNTASRTVSIKSRPQSDFTIDLPPFSCNGSLSQFTDITPNPTDSNISSWLWNFGDVLNGTSGLQHARYTFTSAGQYNVSLTTSTNFGCSAIVQKQVTIQQSPQAAFTNSAACVNQPTTFVDTSTGSIKSRVWNIGSNTYTTPTPSNTFTSPGSYQSQLTVTGNNNCVSTASKTVIVPVPPTVDFSVQNNCSGQNAIFTDTTPAGTDPVATRIWDFANQGAATGSPAQHVFSTVGTYGVKLTVTNQSGCSYPLTKNVAITRTPTANFTATPQNGPAPLVVQFNNTSVNATSFLWQFNDAAGSTSSQLSPPFTFTSLGDYMVKLTATSLLGCQDTFSKEINVIVPHADLAIDHVDLVRNAATGTIKMSLSIRNKGNSVISGASLLLDASGATVLKENVDNVIRPGETIVYITNTELVLRADEIKYLCAEVSITDDKDLSNNKECLLVEDEVVYFPAYPNPSAGLLRLDWIAANEAEANALIVNSFGQKVLDKQIGATREGLNQLQFDVSNLGAGEYILIFNVNRMKKSFRFTII